MDAIQVKDQADQFIGKKVFVNVIANNGITPLELEVSHQRIIENKNICLSYFKDSTFCCNSLLIINDSTVSS